MPRFSANSPTGEEPVTSYSLPLDLDPRVRVEGTDHRIKMLGQEKRFIDKVPLSPVFAIDKILRRKQIAAFLWHCRESNRIFVVMAISKRGADELVSEVASSIQCHEGAISNQQLAVSYEDRLIADGQ